MDPTPPAVASKHDALNLRLKRRSSSRRHRPDLAARKAAATAFETATKALQAVHDLELGVPGNPAADQ
jgi:hypothetical protein